MYKIAILGCENSHANSFLKYIKENEAYSDIETLGVYSIDRAAAEKLSAEFGVKVMESPDELVGKLDGLIITARHGGYHYEFAKHYLNDGIPMFIDKPITVTEEDAYNASRLIGKKEGILAGISSGAAIHAAIMLANLKENANKKIVVLLPDTGDRYLSTPLFED